MTKPRTSEDIAEDRQAIINRLMPLLRKENPAGTTHMRWDDIATLAGLDIVQIQATATPDHADSPELSAAQERIRKARARKAELEAEKAEAEVAELEAQQSSKPETANKATTTKEQPKKISDQ